MPGPYDYDSKRGLRPIFHALKAVKSGTGHVYFYYICQQQISSSTARLSLEHATSEHFAYFLAESSVPQLTHY